MKVCLSIPAALFLLMSLHPDPALSANTVRSTDIVDGQVMTVDLANSAVTSAKIQDGQVLTADLGANAVTTEKILDGTVNTADLASGAVTNAKIAGPIDPTKVPHSHDGTYQHKDPNVLLVSISGNGDFASPIDAMNSIANASASNPYLIKIMPGTYDLGSTSLVMKEFVDVEGSGRGITELRGNLATSGAVIPLVRGISNAEIRNLSIVNIGNGERVVGFSTSNNASVRNVRIVAENQAIWYMATCVFLLGGDTKLRDVELSSGGSGLYAQWASFALEDGFISAGGGGISFSMSSSTVTINNSRITATYDGIFSSSGQLRVSNSVITAANTIKTAGSTGDALYINNTMLTGVVPTNYGTGILKCMSAFDGTYNPLSDLCQ